MVFKVFLQVFYCKDVLILSFTAFFTAFNSNIVPIMAFYSILTTIFKGFNGMCLFVAFYNHKVTKRFIFKAYGIKYNLKCR
jgi:hypothetical protein